MSLYVAEIDTTATAAEPNAVTGALAKIEAAAAAKGGEFIESQVTADRGRVFAVIEHSSLLELRADLEAAGLTVDELALVRLVGAELDDVKKLKKAVSTSSNGTFRLA